MRARALGNRAAACASVTSGLEIRASAAIYSPSSATRMLTVCSRLFRTHTHSTHAHFRAAARLMCPRIKIYVHITRAHLSIISLCVAKRICTNAKCTTKRLSRRAHAKEKFNDLLPSAHGTHTSHPPPSKREFFVFANWSWRVLHRVVVSVCVFVNCGAATWASRRAHARLRCILANACRCVCGACTLAKRGRGVERWEEREDDTKEDGHSAGSPLSLVNTWRSIVISAIMNKFRVGYTSFARVRKHVVQQAARTHTIHTANTGAHTRRHRPNTPRKYT